MRNNPERLAWVVLVSAFVVFCILAVTIPLGVRWYLLNSMTDEVTAVTSVRGTVLAEPRNASLPVPITDGNTIEVEEGAAIVTDDTSQSILTFFNDSTLTLYGNTEVSIQRARTPRYSMGHRPETIVIQLTRGRVRATLPGSATASDGVEPHFEIYTPHTRIHLEEGSFSIEGSQDCTQVTARSGRASLIAADEVVTLLADERSMACFGEAPAPPLPAEQNLLANGDFSEPLEEAWEVYRVEPATGVVTTGVEVVDEGNRRALVFESQGEDNLHSEIGLIQQVDKSVQDFDSLKVHLDVRLEGQSLPGGGTLGSEFPVMVHLAYKDAEGNDRDWYQGFYYKLPPEGWLLFETPDNSSERIAQDAQDPVWYPYESVNLLDSLGSTKPVYIKYIRLYASGWLYKSSIDNVALLAQE